MADELLRLFRGNTKEKAPVEERMLALIEKYTSWIPTHSPLPRHPDGEHVIVTGGTGSLGAHVVSQLARLRPITRIYCLVRAENNYAARGRLLRSLRERAVLEDITPAIHSKIMVLASDLTDRKLGLDDATYGWLIKHITAVIHCAWSVDSHLPLESFENCIIGTHNLLILCLSVEAPKPARFAFCSCVNTVSQSPERPVPEALPKSLTYAHNIGYAQSKLVTECIVNTAAQRTGMIAHVLRLSQMIGDAVHGIWNPSETIPLVLQTAKTIGVLPVLDAVFSWTAVDRMAASVIELTFALDTGDVFNVTNSTLNHWTYDLLPRLKRAGLEFEAVGKYEWLQMLLNTNLDPAVNPPVKLLPFFFEKFDDRLRPCLLYDNKKAQAASPALCRADTLTQDHVTRIVQYLQLKCWT